MTVHRKCIGLTLSAVSCVFLFGAGCGTIVGPGNIPADAPPEIAFVIQNNSRFAQRGTEALADVEVGEVVDDLGNLSGCWGAYYLATDLGLLFTGYEVYRFDPASGEVRYFVLQAASAMLEREMSFSVVANDRIRLRRQFPDGTKEEADVLMTLSGSELKIAYVAQDGNILGGSPGHPEDQRVRLVFRAFDCP